MSLSLFLHFSFVTHQWCLRLVSKHNYIFYDWLKIQGWNCKRSILLFVMIVREEAYWNFKLYIFTRQLWTCNYYTALKTDIQDVISVKWWLYIKYPSLSQFLTFAERLANVNIDIIHRIDRTASYDEVRECLLADLRVFTVGFLVSPLSRSELFFKPFLNEYEMHYTCVIL